MSLLREIKKSIKNPVGLLTSISDGLRLARSNPELLDRILQILGKLQWNAGKSIHEGKAYSAKVIRVFNKLYAYYAGKEDRLEEILLNLIIAKEVHISTLIFLINGKIHCLIFFLV